ncbi:sugar nucleotide-binding protein [Psychrobacillus sp. OK032]|uniref:sugar nucleotide-binding protein n=1 Tax=Psychrobacillus sp. OK032 TaxID=1884358 RepID=UPI0008C7F72D|nr:sugar nucleotide-binding protein [Psychrobacillus sp. OK032]SES46060.1 dTDP-4-dehydrorhamnose reductase [Psychrobacillus sp. OK032]
MKKILILGASGLVGKAIAKECINDFDVYGTYFSSATNLTDDKQFQINIQDEEKFSEILNFVQPDIIVSSLKGDFDDQLKFHRHLAEELKNRNCVLYFFSTTNVFDGDLSRHHSELEEPISKSDYGQYKIDCEKMLTESLGNRANIVRIPGIWGKNSPRFNAIKNNIETAAPIQAYSNLECNFLLDKQLALQMHFILKNELSGIFHLGAVNMVKECAFYEELVNKLTNEKVNIHPKPYQDKECTYYFGLVSNREDLTDHLKITNEQIITYLVS